MTRIISLLIFLMMSNSSFANMSRNTCILGSTTTAFSKPIQQGEATLILTTTCERTSHEMILETSFMTPIVVQEDEGVYRTRLTLINNQDDSKTVIWQQQSPLRSCFKSYPGAKRLNISRVIVI